MIRNILSVLRRFHSTELAQKDNKAERIAQFTLQIWRLCGHCIVVIVCPRNDNGKFRLAFNPITREHEKQFNPDEDACDST